MELKKRVAANTDTSSNPDGLIYVQITVAGALHAFRSHSLPHFEYIADPKTLLFLSS